MTQDKCAVWYGSCIGKLPDSLADRKPDAANKPDLTCFIDQFPLAMAAIAEVHDYERGPLVKGDYRPSLLRHLFKIGEHPDHDAAMVWNAIAWLELREREKQAP